jgi:hypothetical protein
VNALADRGAAQTFGGGLLSQGGGVDGAGLCMSLQQPSCLRVVDGLTAQATACITLAGLQDEGKSI